MKDFKTMPKMIVDLHEIKRMRLDRTHLMEVTQNLIAVIEKFAPFLQTTQEYNHAKQVLENINDNEI